MLFGVRFTNDNNNIRTLLEHYYTWKYEKANAIAKEIEEIASIIGKKPGLSEQEIQKTLERYEMPSKVKPPDFKEVGDLLGSSDCRHYYITQPVLTMSSKIRGA